jgi:hypothetical protein
MTAKRIKELEREVEKLKTQRDTLLDVIADQRSALVLESFHWRPAASPGPWLPLDNKIVYDGQPGFTIGDSTAGEGLRLFMHPTTVGES